MTKATLLNKFATKTKTIRVEAWDTDVTIKQLNVSEGIKVQTTLLGVAALSDIQKGKVEIGIEGLSKSTIMAVSFSLVEPKLSIKDLDGMGPDGLVGINEIKAAIDVWDAPKK